MLRLSRYLWAEILPLFALALFVLSFLMVSGRLLQLDQWIIPSGGGLKAFGVLFLLLAPSLAAYLVPLAFLLALLFAFSRLSGDSEIVAMKASGIGLGRILAAVAPLMGLLAALGLGINLWLQPWALQAARQKLGDLIEAGIDRPFQPGVYIDAFPGWMLTFEERLSPEPGTDPRRRRVGMKRLLIVPDPGVLEAEAVITARTGWIELDPRSWTARLKLSGGEAHWIRPPAPDQPDRYEVAQFGALDLTVAMDTERLRHLFAERRPPEMTLAELRANDPQLSARDRLERKHELGRRFSLPWSVLVFGWLGVPLGIRFHRAGRSGGFGVAALVALAYYLLMFLGQEMVSRWGVSPLAAFNLPNLALGAVGIVYFRKKSAE